MNKKGFTLAEVLAVIVVIGILVTIAIPSINTITKNINKRLLSNKRTLILKAAEQYAKDNTHLFTSDIITIKVGDLIRDKYIDSEDNSVSCASQYGCISNPVDKIYMNEEEITIKKVGNTFEANWKTLHTTDSSLISTAKTRLSCSSITSTSPCLNNLTGSNGYIKYNGTNLKMIGIYVENGVEVLRLQNTEVSLTNTELITKIKTELNCSSITSDSPCVYKGNVSNNYVEYNGIMWRIVGIYNVGGQETLKLITDDIISWEE